MQNQENKTVSQQIADARKNEIYATLCGLHEEHGLRQFQESLAHCIYWIAIHQPADEPIDQIDRNHIDYLKLLSDQLRKIEDCLIC